MIAYECAEWCNKGPEGLACSCTVIYLSEDGTRTPQRLTEEAANANYWSWRNPANIVAQGRIPGR
jgi:hypothetical protein